MLDADAAQLGHGQLEGILVTGGVESHIQAALNFEPAAPVLLEATAPAQVAAPPMVAAHVPLNASVPPAATQPLARLLSHKRQLSRPPRLLPRFAPRCLHPVRISSRRSPASLSVSFRWPSLAPQAQSGPLPRQEYRRMFCHPSRLSPWRARNLRPQAPLPLRPPHSPHHPRYCRLDHRPTSSPCRRAPRRKHNLLPSNWRSPSRNRTCFHSSPEPHPLSPQLRYRRVSCRRQC